MNKMCIQYSLFGLSGCFFFCSNTGKHTFYCSDCVVMKFPDNHICNLFNPCFSIDNIIVYPIYSL